MRAFFALAVLAATSGTDTPAQRGREIFVDGRAADASISATFAGSAAPIDAALVPCASCHGEDGGGGNVEGGAQPADVSAQALSQPAHLPQRDRTAYTRALLKRAITMGYDASGNLLDRAMPRFALTQREADDLLAYLTTLDHTSPLGVTDDTVRIAVVGAQIPDAPPMKIYGRRLEITRDTAAALITIDASADADVSIARAERERRPLIALRASLAQPGAYSFVVGASSTAQIAALRHYARSVGVNSAIVANDCSNSATWDPATIVLLSAAAASACEVAAIPAPMDRRVIVAAPYPPDAHTTQQLVEDVIAHVATILSALGRDFTTRALLSALENTHEVRLHGMPAASWGPNRHVASERAWLMTLDTHEQRLLASPGWFGPGP